MIIIPTLRYKSALAEGLINFGGVGYNVGTPHNITVVLMKPSFNFDPTTQGYYSDISADELSTGNGYTVNNKSLNPLTISFDGDGKLTIQPTAAPYWDAVGGTIGPFYGAALIANNTDKVFIGYISFDTVTLEQNNRFYIYNIKLNIT
jgi:hypothetical protein